MAAPRQLVDNPATFTPLPYGLLSVVQQPTPPSYWGNGITYQTSCVVSGDTTYDECIAVTGTGPPPEPGPKEATTELDLRGATAFTVYVRFDCSPVGIDDAQTIATRALTQSAPWQVERAFWTGIADGQEVVYPHLAADAEVIDADGILLQSDPTVIVTGSADIVDAVGSLEKALGDCYNGEGVIHVSRRVFEHMVAAQLVEFRGPTARTRNGNAIAVGSGYPGSGPAGQPAGTSEWIFGTGAVFAFSSPVRIIGGEPSSFNRLENTREMIAEQNYLLGWDCCHVAVEVPVIL